MSPLPSAPKKPRGSKVNDLKVLESLNTNLTLDVARDLAVIFLQQYYPVDSIYAGCGLHLDTQLDYFNTETNMWHFTTNPSTARGCNRPKVLKISVDDKTQETSFYPRSSKNKREIVFGGLNWDSALVQNAVARYIVENGYEYLTSQIGGDTVPLIQKLRKGDVDILMEIWLPNQNEIWDEAMEAGDVLHVGKSLEDNWQSSFLIPAYVHEQYPNLDNVEDLKDGRYKELFSDPYSGGKAVLYGCMAAWACRGVQEGTALGVGQIAAYGLSEHVELRDVGTNENLVTVIEDAFNRGVPILFYYWGPTALMSSLEEFDLEQPDPSNCLDNDPVHGCAFPDAEVMIAMNTELTDDAPELISFFRKWNWDATNQLAAEAFYNENYPYYETIEESLSASAINYLKNNNGWKAWVPAGVLSKVENALANES